MDPFREKIFQVNAFLIASIFFVIIYAMNWLGYYVKKRIVQHKPEKDLSLGTAEGALMGLMALLLAFTFGLASSKYETRRQTIIDEANLLNTALFRIKLYPDSIKRTMLNNFKKYLDSRIDYWNGGDDPVKVNAALESAGSCFNNLWNDNALLTNDPNNRSRAEQLVPVLISLKNMVVTREAGRVATIPSLIILVLLILVFVASFLTGFGLKPGSRNPVFSVAFTLMLSVALYIIMELSRPQQGFMNLESAEKNIVDIRKNL